MNLCEKVAILALKDTKGPEIWLEASTERSESNPGRSLGIIKHEGTAVWKTVPHKMCSLAFGSLAIFKINHG